MRNEKEKVKGKEIPSNKQRKKEEKKKKEKKEIKKRTKERKMNENISLK